MNCLAKLGSWVYYWLMGIAGKTAIITGSTGRLGGAIAIALAHAGCDCVCHYHRNDHLAENLVEVIRSMGQEAIAVGADLTQTDEIDGLFEVAGEMGGASILVNSAAIFKRQAIADVDLTSIEEVLNTNLVGPMLVSKRFAELLDIDADCDEPVGKIVNISDVGAIKPWAEYSVYCASKAGLVGMTKAMAKELAPAVCVNAVAPGVITWPDGFSDEDKKRQLGFIPAGRIGQLSEVASAVIFLLENDYITGQTLAVDGGRAI